MLRCENQFRLCLNHRKQNEPPDLELELTEDLELRVIGTESQRCTSFGRINLRKSMENIFPGPSKDSMSTNPYLPGTAISYTKSWITKSVSSKLL